jgi:hypothetical protein
MGIADAGCAWKSMDDERMKISHSIQELIPPIFLRPRRRNCRDDEILFDGEDSLFRKLMASCSVYGEYGVGLSTVAAFNDYECDIIAVDTSREWINEVAARGVSLEDDRVNIRWIDVGPLSSWGRPSSYEKSNSFAEYTHHIWSQDLVPNLVLIDGRFRVACLLDSLLSGKSGTFLLFDDYTDRPFYHVVERIVTPVHTTDRQALFVIPEVFDRVATRRMYDQFLMVMD